MGQFKQTDIGLIPEDWACVNLEEAVDRIDYGLSEAIPKNQDFDGIKNVSTADITRDGKLLYDQIRKVKVSEKIIERLKLDDGDILFNWRNSSELIGKTTIYFNQPTTHIFASFILRIKCNPAKSINVYLKLLLNYYRVTGVFIKLSRRAVNQANYNRNEIRILRIPLPPLSEQKKIAHILSKIQQAIETQEQIIKTTQELKKSLMQKLFTEGLNGEPQKQTEIGLIPESWEVKRIDEVYRFTKKPKDRIISDNTKLPFIPMEYISDSKLAANDFTIKKYSEIPSGTYFENGDLLLAKITPSFENGKQGIASINLDFGYATTEVIPIQSIENLSDSKYLFYYLLKEDVRLKLAGKMEGSTGRQRLPKNVVQSLIVPFPRIEVQLSISSIFVNIDDKIQLTKRRIDYLMELFSNLLNKLMTGQIRVKDIEFKLEEMEYS